MYVRHLITATELPSYSLNVDIQQKKHRPSALWKRVDDAGSTPSVDSASNPLHSLNSNGPEKTDSILNGSASPSWTSSTAQPRNVRPCENVEQGPSVHHPAHEMVGSLDTLGMYQGSNTASFRPRKFHLSKTSSPMLSLTIGGSCGVRKHRGHSRADLAVFEEKVKRAYTGSMTVKNEPLRLVPVSERPLKPQKRPNATAVEKAWRNKTWKHISQPRQRDGKPQSPKQTKTDDRFDAHSMELAMQLQQYVEKESQPQNHKENSSDQRQPKIRPKPPKTRESKETAVRSEPNAISIANNPEKKSEFIYDTYIRDVVNLSQPGLSACQIQRFETDKVGIIVIEEAEEEVWDTFGEYDESGSESDGDEDDENGKSKARTSPS